MSIRFGRESHGSRTSSSGCERRRGRYPGRNDDSRKTMIGEVFRRIADR